MNLRLSKVLKGIFGVALVISVFILFVWRLAMQGVTFSEHFTIEGSTYLLGILGVVMFAVEICIRMICKKDNGLKYLIITDFMLSTWIYLHSEAITLPFRECISIRFIRITMLTLLMIPILLFFDEFQEYRYHKTYMTFSILPILDWAGCLGVFFLIGFYSNDIFMACQIITVMILTICLYHLFIDYIKYHRLVTKQVLLALLFIFAGSVCEIIYVWIDGFKWINILIGYLAAISIFGIFQSVVLATVRDYLEEQKQKQRTEAEYIFQKLHNDAVDYLENIKKENHYILEHCMDDELFQRASDLAWQRWRLANLLQNMEDCIAISNEITDITLERVSMGEVNNYIIRNTIEEAERKNIELLINIEENFPKEIFGIKSIAERMLFNLLLYAIEATEEGQKVTLQTGYLHIREDLIKVITTVESSSSGMDIEEFKTVQNIFKHLDTIEIIELEKLGLGLCTATALAKILKGTMFIENELGKGTRIQVATVCRIADATPIGEFKDWYIIEESSYQKYRKRVLKKKKEESLNQKIVEKNETEMKNASQKKAMHEQNDKSILYDGDIHVDGALKYVGDDYQQYVQIMRLFPEKKQEKQKMLEQYYQAKDYQNYTIQVHALKNNARMLGADKLADMAFEHEKAGTQENGLYLETHYEELLTEWNRVEAVFRQYLDTKMRETSGVSGNETLQTIDKKEWQERVKEMLECLELFQKKETLEILEGLKTFGLNEEQMKVVDNTMDAVKRYDYDSAIGILKECME